MVLGVFRRLVKSHTLFPGKKQALDGTKVGWDLQTNTLVILSVDQRVGEAFLAVDVLSNVYSASVALGAESGAREKRVQGVHAVGTVIGVLFKGLQDIQLVIVALATVDWYRHERDVARRGGRGDVGYHR